MAAGRHVCLDIVMPEAGIDQRGWSYRMTLFCLLGSEIGFRDFRLKLFAQPGKVRTHQRHHCFVKMPGANRIITLPGLGAVAVQSPGFILA